MSLNLTTILGARPQFIKASSLSRGVKKLNGQRMTIQETIVHTGQHYDIEMSDVFFSELEIPQPALKLTASSQSRPERFAEMMAGLGPFLKENKPDVVLVFGDTDTTLAGAICASQLGIPLAHVEAGLRSFNKAMPEETNRVLTDHASQFLFCPTKTAVRNLSKEGIPRHTHETSDTRVQVVQCGDIQLETLRHYAQKSTHTPRLKSRLATFLKQNEPFALATLHRAENTASRQQLEQILRGISAVSDILPVILPLHPGTRKKMQKHGLRLTGKRILTLPPLGFLDIIELLKKTSLVMTDSGGLQKEAYFMNKPCLTLRKETEWSELVEYGFNEITGVNEVSILKGAEKMLSKRYDWSCSLYGNGDTARTILEILLKTLN